jgi:hypothetical protein
LPAQRTRRFARNLLLLVMLFTMPGRALGQASAFTLEAQLPAELRGCFSASDLRAAYVHALAAYGIQRHGESNLVVRVRAHPDTTQDGIVLELSATMSGRSLGRSELHVTEADCDALPRTLGQVLARMARQQSAADANKPLLPLPAEAFLQPSATGSTEPSEYVVLGLGAGVVGGMLPSAAFALHLQAATPNHPLSMRLRATLLWPQSQTLKEGVIDTRAYEVSLELCGGFRLPSWQRLALRLCLGPRVGVEVGRGRKFPVYNGNPVDLYAYLGAAPEAALQLGGNTWLQLGGGAALGLVRPHFVLGIDSARRSIELSNPAVVRSELSASLLQIF